MSSGGRLSHAERTALEPRESDIHRVILKRIDQVNHNIRLLRLGIPMRRSITASTSPNTFLFLPGQWLDVFIPGFEKPGGFTITSTPVDATSSSKSDGHLELAIQRSPNPPAAWLSQPRDVILDKELFVRVGGSFVWPPPYSDLNTIKRVVFVAGGVGINPLISMLGHLDKQHATNNFTINFIYTTRAPSTNVGEVLFITRLRQIFSQIRSPTSFLHLHLTGDHKISLPPPGPDYEIPIIRQRPTEKDLYEALGPEEERSGVVAYVCGPPAMTDSFVEILQAAKGMDRKRVLCEKWW
ncbi:MAG: hypothetical protein MMC33_005215 [Icmadophila ericetorum]|nr:hypothetical protein [Icmadophila ericetorum]